MMTMTTTMTPEAEAKLKAQIQMDLVEIRYFVRQIETPEQFEDILWSIVDPAMRKEVETLLTPLLRFPYPMTRLDA